MALINIRNKWALSASRGCRSNGGIAGFKKVNLMYLKLMSSLPLHPLSWLNFLFL